MIAIEELRRIAKIKGISLGDAEKDYLMDLILLSVSKNTKDELVFKGGTCLYKFYKIDRFSSDTDFTALKPVDIVNLMKNITDDLRLFGVEANVKKQKQPFNSILTTLKCKGPLYTGSVLTFSGLRIDINLKSSVDLEIVNSIYNSIYPDIPRFSILVMKEEEILAEKIRAILTRNKARDMYDVWFMLKKGIKIGTELLNKKLEYYKLIFDVQDFEKSLNKKKPEWERELKPLVSVLPSFEEVKKYIIAEMLKIL